MVKRAGGNRPAATVTAPKAVKSKTTSIRAFVNHR